MTRVLSGAVLLALAVAVVWWAPPLLLLAVAELLLLQGAVEFAKLAQAGGLAVPTLPLVVAAMLTCGAFALGVPPPIDAVLMAASIALGAITLAAWNGGRDALAVASASAFPSLYLGLPLGAMVAIRAARGPGALFLLMVAVMVSDTAQYYTGRAWGRRRLAPAISPGKTVEGALGGLVCGAAAMVVGGAWWLPGLPPALTAGLGAAVAALGILGDLFESMLKRSAGVKDSSSLIPGHGGVLDRIDALLFAAPLYYVVLKYV
jgi:phosphatidate cytidylyltransferase